jgi:hypothetical protein
MAIDSTSATVLACWFLAAMSASTRPSPLPPHVNIGPRLLVTSYLFMFLSTITTGLRLWVRGQNYYYGLDDLTIALATCCAIALSTMSIAGVKHGKGRHVWYLTHEQILAIGKLSWIGQVVLFCGICMVKMSVCFLVLRIKADSRRLRLCLYVVMSLTVATTIIPIIALSIECRPLHAFWNRSVGHCRSSDFRIYSIWVQACRSFPSHKSARDYTDRP